MLPVVLDGELAELSSLIQVGLACRLNDQSEVTMGTNLLWREGFRKGIIVKIGAWWCLAFGGVLILTRLVHVVLACSDICTGKRHSNWALEEQILCTR